MIYFVCHVVVRDRQNRGALKKEIQVLLKAHLFFSKWCGVVTYFFTQKRKRKKLNTTLHD